MISYQVDMVPELNQSVEDASRVSEINICKEGFKKETCFVSD